MSQIRAQKIRRGTMTKVKSSGEMIDALMKATIPFLRIFLFVYSDA
jgi:hypothetical protein